MISLCHLKYEDDTFLISDAFMANLCDITTILHWFGLAYCIYFRAVFL